MRLQPPYLTFDRLMSVFSAAAVVLFAAQRIELLLLCEMDIFH
jgi:hypothetical protein